MTRVAQRLTGARRSLARRLRGVSRSLREAGLRGVLAKVGTRTVDHLFDLRYGLDTCRWASLADLRVPEALRRHGVDYEPTGVWEFRAFMRDAPLPRTGAFLDLGSGKGRVLLLASRYGFDRVVGVEMSEELCAVARRNLATFLRAVPTASPMDVICADAAGHVVDDDTTVFFLFNPFGGVVLKQVLERIRESLERRPREATLVYSNAQHASAVEQVPVFAHVGTYAYPRAVFTVYRCGV